MLASDTTCLCNNNSISITSHINQKQTNGKKLIKYFINTGVFRRINHINIQNRGIIPVVYSLSCRSGVVLMYTLTFMLYNDHLSCLASSRTVFQKIHILNVSEQPLNILIYFFLLADSPPGLFSE